MDELTIIKFAAERLEVAKVENHFGALGYYEDGSIGKMARTGEIDLVAHYQYMVPLVIGHYGLIYTFHSDNQRFRFFSRYFFD